MGGAHCPKNGWPIGQKPGPRTRRRSLGWPPTRWTDDLVREGVGWRAWGTGRTGNLGERPMYSCERRQAETTDTLFHW
ncbi:unnamed protein product [Pieris macdunnoughi]|uniref:Uncharacterized protein n=1 Tax=Pieris macdunnoughi TaxID=345717 RepID=A0A821Q3C7_9NEOP|nr:unnamed protein product [Pieris macdunnoughi]